ncbi:MAG: dithiol-disulfide isomerase [Chloroflexi bacterium]|nr:dithiol-disulfide isomerase [Chloroflexota bacterium]
MAVYRLRQVWDGYRGRLRIAWKTLALEIKNSKPTPKQIVDKEIVLMARQDLTLPIGPWQARDSEYPATILPAFEAIKCSERQGDALAWAFSWNVRAAYFAESRCISMRHVLRDIAAESGLDVERFLAEWDTGQDREQILAESHHGWEVIKVLNSPTFVLADGRQFSNPAASKVTWGPGGVILDAQPPARDWREVYREILEAAVALGGSSSPPI